MSIHLDLLIKIFKKENKALYKNGGIMLLLMLSCMS